MTSPSVRQLYRQDKEAEMAFRQGYRQVVRQPYRQHKEKCL